MLPAILICAFMVKNAATQSVTASLGTTKSCVLIGDDVKLLCTASTGCCDSSRVWDKVGVAPSLLDDGLSSDPSKYMEENGGGTVGGSIEFSLVIKNVQTSDFEVNYQCRYGLKSSNELFLNATICNCWKCAGTDYGWSVIGTAIGTVIIIIAKLIIMIIAKVKKVEPGTVLIVGGLTFIISAAVNIPVALPIGRYVCHCVNGTDPWLIVLGLGTSVITGVIIIIKMKLKQGSSQGSNGSSCWPPCKVEQEPKNPKKPSSNEQPLKENKKKKPAAEKSSNEPPLEKKKKKKSAAETGSNEPPLEKKKKKKSAAETGSRSPTSAAKHIKTANNETEMIPTEKGFSGDLEKKRPLPPLTTQLSPTNRPLPLPSSTKPLSSSTRPLPQITTNKGDN